MQLTLWTYEGPPHVGAMRIATAMEGVHYSAETFYQMVRSLAGPHAPAPGFVRPQRDPSSRPSCNILGATAMGFRHRDDVAEIRKLLGELGVEVRVVAPLGTRPADLARLGEADFNVALYPETAGIAAGWLERTFKQPRTRTVPIGYGAAVDFVNEVAEITGIDPSPVLNEVQSRLPWYSRSIDSIYLTSKRVFIFADATHAIAASRVAADEFGFEVVGLGTYSREFARDVRKAAERFGIEALITDDYLEVEQAVAEAQVELLLGTQMERHIAKRLGSGCAVISAPVHVQDFPARYSPQMGFEGANVLWDSWVHPLYMGLEEHLLGMFREDFEFGDHAAPSHLGHGHAKPTGQPVVAEPVAEPVMAMAEAVPVQAAAAPLSSPSADEPPHWAVDAEKELKKIPFFVRGKARRNTERFAADHGVALITVETLYDAKAHFGR